ncbi:MAG: LD-carboxypeptidase [Bacteroidales bacterium]
MKPTFPNKFPNFVSYSFVSSVMLQPPFLKPDDQIRIVSPAGTINPNYVDGAANCIHSFGFNPVSGQHAKGVFGRYSGTVDERLSDLYNAFHNKDAKAILCSRGGYGMMQLLAQISPDVIRNNPKWVIGYSDMTAFHALMQKNGVMSIHSPMAHHLSEKDDFFTKSLFQILTGNIPEYSFEPHSLNREGLSCGILRGGNLSVLMALRGTPYDFEPRGTILFLEDISERPYQVERMLLNLKLGGVLESLSGLIIGQFTDYEEDESMMKTLNEIIADVVAEYDYPVAFNFPVGHVSENYPLICGATVELKIDKKPMLSFRLSE